MTEEQHNLPHFLQENVKGSSIDIDFALANKSTKKSEGIYISISVKRSHMNQSGLAIISSIRKNKISCLKLWFERDRVELGLIVELVRAFLPGTIA